MIALSNKKFLSLFAAMLVACSFVEVVNAEALRGSQFRREENTRERRLKMSASSKGKSSKGAGFSQVFLPPVVGVPNTLNPPLVVNPVDTSDWGKKCPNDEYALKSCVRTSGGSEIDSNLCFLCIQGQANLSTTTRLGLNSCSNPKLGGYCRECYEEVAAFYECGSAAPLPPPAMGGGDTTTTIADPNAGAVSPPVPVSPTDLYAPVTMCPFEAPASGDTCDTFGYKYLECLFRGLKCTCRNDTLTFMCLEI